MSLLEAKKRGSDLVINFVNQRLIVQESSEEAVKSFYAKIPKNSALTLSDLFEVEDTNDRKKEGLQHVFNDIEVFVSGGLIHEEDVRSTNPESDVSSLAATHEEADTRVVLHAFHSDADNIVTMARDTDICLLLIHHFDKMTSSKVWMMSGTAEEKKYLPIHEICQLLDNLGHSPLTPSSKANAEKFLVQLYKVTKDVSSGDEARYQLFGVVKKPEALPPSSGYTS
ncbi:unnamed protein product [Phaedon cochleariae]|uniref:Uncharacterized protein n=1 Tax=Phaedon cochleariae TaxID=80249 RepID=A0A9N9X154_PHACE|nr:unnamed protein product [Phaedon cochleariae]